MTPTRRDTLKAAGAASGLAMLGSHVIAQQDSPGSSDDDPGAQQLEEGQAGVRVGHFVAGAPAVNVRLVPADGSAGGGGGDTNGTNTTDDTNETNTTNDTNDTGGSGMDAPDDTTGGAGELLAEDVAFGDVSEYTSVAAGDYTVQLVDPSADPTDTNGTNTINDTDDSAVSLPPDLTDEDNGTNDTNDSNASNVTNSSEDNTSEDLQVGNDSNDTNDTNDTDDGMETPDDTTGGEVIYQEDITVGETYYTVAAVGTSVDDIQALLLKDYDAAQVRLVHASPDAPAVDVVAPDASMTLFDDVSFGQATEYVGVPPGSYSLSVREAAAMNDGDEVLSEDVEVDAGEAYSVYAVGSPEGGEDQLQLVVEQDGQGADAGLGEGGAPGQQPGGPGGNGTDNATGNGSGSPPGQDDGDGQRQGQGPGDDNATGNDSDV